MNYYLNNLTRLIRVFIPFLFLVILLGECFSAYGQNTTGKGPGIAKEKNNLYRTIHAMVGDDQVREKIHLYQLEEAINAYERVLTALLHHKPILPVLWSLNIVNSEIITTAFSQFKEHSLLNDFATYKRVSASPAFIFHFLEKNPNFRFTDSLLREVVADDPMNIVYYLRDGDPRLQQRILQSGDSYIRNVASLYSEKHAGELTMFASQLSEGKMSQEDLLSTRTEPAKYFQLLVNTFLESKRRESSGLQFNLRKGIKDKALAFYVNEVNDFFHRLSPGKLQEVLVLFIGNIEMDPNSTLERAMDIADSFGSLGSAPEILNIFQSEIGDNLARCKSKQSLLGVRLYGILHDMLGLSIQTDGLQKLWKALGNYELLKRSVLEDTKGTVSELVLFYGDEDGVASFKNFMSKYDNNRKWQVSRNKHWVSIRSLAGHPLVIFANLPLNMQNRADLAAQDSLFAYLRANAIEPSILVHRGHSYHLDKTLKRLTPAVKLAILGSCGAYNKAISIASINPDVQIIGSKQTGTQAINDPIIEMVNVLLGNGNDLVWPEIWNNLDAQFRKNEAMRIMFSEYFPPSHNLGLFILKLYRSNLRIGDSG